MPLHFVKLQLEAISRNVIRLDVVAWKAASAIGKMPELIFFCKRQNILRNRTVVFLRRDKSISRSFTEVAPCSSDSSRMGSVYMVTVWAIEIIEYL